MRKSEFDARSSKWLVDMAMWLKLNANTNSEVMIRLNQNLTRAIDMELTPRQREIVTMYFYEGLNLPQISKKLGISTSTASRTLKNAKNRLFRVLRYSL